MAKFNVKLNTFNDVKVFCDKVCKVKGPVDLSHGRYCIDAKSIQGIYALGLSNVLVAECRDEDAATLAEAIKDWRVD